VSNYGFLEDPVRLIRATRLAARLGWELEEKTQTRFQNAKEENAIDGLLPFHQGYELEEIAHEEDGLKILKVLEGEGWMQKLFPAWTSAKADTAGLEEMREVLVQLQMQGVNPDTSTAQMELLTAKMAPKDIQALKHLIARPGFVEDWERLDSDAKEFAKVLTGKQAATPSSTWKLFTTYNPEAILWLGLTGKNAAVQTKFKNFFTVWPEARQKIPYALLQEMRITLELEGYQDLLRSIFLDLIDDKLGTEEEMRAFLEPHSPPAPPPPVSIRRTRSKKSEAKLKMDEDEDDEDVPIRLAPDDLDDKIDDGEDAGPDEEEDDDELAPLPKTVKSVAPKPNPVSSPPPGAKSAEKNSDHASSKPAPKAGKHDSKQAIPAAPEAKPSGKAVAQKPAAPAKNVPQPKVKPSAKSPAKPPAKHVSTQPAKSPTKHVAAKPAPAKKSGSKPSVAKKSASKPAPKHKLTKTVAKPKPVPLKVVKKAVAAKKKKR
jgi:tRNA nucleotidyltransferase (CCA-adding enzyme)